MGVEVVGVNPFMWHTVVVLALEADFHPGNIELGHVGLLVVCL